MKIFRAVRKVESFNIDEKKFLEWLKKENYCDKDIQESNSLNELIEIFGGLGDFDADFDKYFYEINADPKILDSSYSYYDNFSDAYQEKEWGMH